jgi:hypothetical protein
MRVDVVVPDDSYEGRRETLTAIVETVNFLGRSEGRAQFVLGVNGRSLYFFGKFSRLLMRSWSSSV